MEILYLYYSARENVFYDECGQRIDNIFERISPKDLYLFRLDPGRAPFPYIHQQGLWCEIIDMDETPYDEEDYEEEMDNPWILEMEMARNRWGISERSFV